MPAGAEYPEYGLTPDDATPHRYQIPISDDDGDRIIAITLTDRGIGDDNLPVNDVIVDDGGPSLPMTKKGDPGGDGSGTSPGRSHDPAGGGWGWGVNRRAPDCTVGVADAASCPDVGAACYGYLINGGSSWSGWRYASCTESDGTTSYQMITAGSVPFNLDSGTQNMIKFRIDDAAPNTGESGEYTVKIDAADPPAPVISSSTHPDEGVSATEIVKC